MTAMSDPRSKPFFIVEFWLALILPVATVIALVGLVHIASKSGFTEIAEPATAVPP